MHLRPVSLSVQKTLQNNGARGGNRTHTPFRKTDFKSVASTSSATRANELGKNTNAKMILCNDFYVLVSWSAQLSRLSCAARSITARYPRWFDSGIGAPLQHIDEDVNLDPLFQIATRCALLHSRQYRAGAWLG
jgi:hypothetical protein